MSNNVNVNRRISGSRNETFVASTVKEFTSCVYRNIYFPTILTKKSTTEIDIIFYYQGTIFIVETKNIISIEGRLDQTKWVLTSKSGSYKAYNIVGQNKIHTRVFKNRFFERFGYFPQVISFVVVPNGTVYESVLETEILTVDTFRRFLSCYRNMDNRHMKYQFMSFLEERV